MDGSTSTAKWDIDRIFRLLLTGAGVLALFFLVRYLSDVLLPFAAAVLIAFLLNPIVNLLDKRIEHRVASVLITVFGLMLVGLLLFGLFVPIVHNQVTGIADMLAQQADQALPVGADASTGAEAPKSWKQRYDAFRERQPEGVQQMIDALMEGIADANLGAVALQAANRLAPGVWGVVSGVMNLLLGMMGLVIVVLYLVFLLIDYPHYDTEWREMIPPTYRTNVVEFFEEFMAGMSKYFRNQAVIAMSVGVLFSIGFWLIGLRMSIVLGLLIEALNMVPYLQTVGLVPALVLAVIRAIENEGGLLGSVLLVLLVFGVVQLIQDAFLTPRIMGSATGLRPVAIMLGLFVWGKLLGFLGVLLAIPLTVLGLAYYRRFVLNPERAGVVVVGSHIPDSGPTDSP